MKSIVAVAVAVLAGSVTFLSCNDDKRQLTLINVSYDPTRELYREISERFTKAHQAKTGQTVVVDNSHGGAGAQARARLRGVPGGIATPPPPAPLPALDAPRS